MENFSLSTIDLVLMILYVVLVIWYGLKHAKQNSSEEYFLAGRNMIWPVVGISLFAANISSTTLIGLAGDAYDSGIAVYNYEWMAAVVLVFFAIFFLPFYLRSKVYTMPEFLERRYDARSRYYFSFVTLVGNVIIDTASGLYAGNLILKIIFPQLDSWMIIAMLSIAAAAYTIPGGLSSVVHTEVVQAILLIAGSIVLTVFCFVEIGGWDNMMEVLNQKFSSGTLKEAPEEMLSLVKPTTDPSMPWTGLLFGAPLLGFYFWANNQFMVQRVLSAKDLNHGRWGALFGGLLKLPVLFIMVFPGIAAIVLFSDIDLTFLNYMTTNSAGEEVICENLANCPNMTYPVLLFKLLPTGLLGLVLAGLLAAMSSSISATLNSASTLITMDFVQKINPNLTSKQLVRVGQISTVVLVVLAAAWAPQIEKFGSLFKYLQDILGLIAPPVVAVFILGLFWKRANAQGAFSSLMVGFAIAVFFVLSMTYDISPELNKIHFLHRAPIIMVICMAVQVFVSLATPKPSEEKTASYVWKKEMFTQETEELKGMSWYKNYRILSVLLLVITGIIVGIFW